MIRILTIKPLSEGNTDIIYFLYVCIFQIVYYLYRQRKKILKTHSAGDLTRAIIMGLPTHSPTPQWP